LEKKAGPEARADFTLYRVAVYRQFFVAAGFSLRLHRLESLCHRLTATWYYQSDEKHSWKNFILPAASLSG
jgi:hypothetical protein